MAFVGDTPPTADACGWHAGVLIDTTPEARVVTPPGRSVHAPLETRVAAPLQFWTPVKSERDALHGPLGWQLHVQSRVSFQVA